MTLAASAGHTSLYPKMLTPEDLRKEILVPAGVPQTFLDALERLAEYDDLQYIAKKPDAAYFYLPDICDGYSILRGQTITAMRAPCPGH